MVMHGLFIAMWLSGQPVDSEVGASGPSEEEVALDLRTSSLACPAGAPVIVVGSDQQRSARATGTALGNQAPDYPQSGGNFYCAGHYGEISACLLVISSAQVRLEVVDSSGVDSTMMLRSSTNSDELYCDDDSAGDLRPELTVQLTEGSYEVYVGTYSRGNSAAYELFVQW